MVKKQNVFCRHKRSMRFKPPFYFFRIIYGRNCTGSSVNFKLTILLFSCTNPLFLLFGVLFCVLAHKVEDTTDAGIFFIQDLDTAGRRSDAHDEEDMDKGFFQILWQ
ncbi:MAG: hypothetical protein JW969_09745 [Spirochaetales bacterium]|nr:hypothetical protein [Spirochaetales bacterium]